MKLLTYTATMQEAKWKGDNLAGVNVNDLHDVLKVTFAKEKNWKHRNERGICDTDMNLHKKSDRCRHCN